jgi:dolichol-phosphate mannosyltransferase
VTTAVVCIPTFNERENLEPMLRALADKGVRVLVIDDSSPDGTGELADRLAAELSYVDVLHRPRKDGLGPAYLAGFRRALADVLGSRYVAGGAVRNWGLVRRFVSAGGSLYARIVLGVRVRDLTGGFKCYRRRVLETIDLDAVHSKGYAFQIETTYRALRAGFTVVEVPITFADREAGGSKMSRAIVAEAIWKVPALRLSALRGRL